MSGVPAEIFLAFDAYLLVTLHFCATRRARGGRVVEYRVWWWGGLQAATQAIYHMSALGASGCAINWGMPLFGDCDIGASVVLTSPSATVR